MNCNEVKELLMPFHDGELDPATAAEVEKSLASCESCQSELAELGRIGLFANAAFAMPVEGVDLAGVYDGVMARIAAEDAVEATSNAIEGVRLQRAPVVTEPSLWERVRAWLGEAIRFERPVAGMALAGAALAVIAGVWIASQGPSADAPGNAPAIAQDTAAPAGVRRGREGEVAVRDAVVENTIADVGEVKVIELGADDAGDSQALVLWHVVDGEGVQLPEPANNVH
ncbi:MAG: zf-HC2 domain-containing protein [Myxococcales bacterium]|nr:zf-HC2 domain-containing protein [Myxococcales bacterium]MCB9734653.1 zf-HC2 domain-containing protein [Deltaproteobacteria bacterium]